MGASKSALVQREFPFAGPDSALLIFMMGRRLSGKDEVARIATEFTIGTQRVAFADELKRELSEATGETIEWLEQNKQNGIIRHLMQTWGEFKREVHGVNYWIKELDKKLPAIIRTNAVVIGTDLRYPNEHEYVKSQGGLVVKVERDLERNDPTDSHRSEAWVDYAQADYVIKNDETIDDLKGKVFRMLEWADEQPRRAHP